MNPRLVSISGLTEGQTFALEGARLTIGRTADNDLRLPSLEVSRHHCELRRTDDGRFTLVDLGSRHGVFVNSRPVGERRLEHSDLVTIGGNVFLFLLDDSAAPRAPSQNPYETPFVATSTIARKPTETLYFDSQRLDAILPKQARIGRDLQTLLEASRAFQGPLSVAVLAERLLAAVTKAIPAERAAVLLAEEGDKALSPIVTHSPGGISPSVDPALLGRALSEKVGLLCQGETSSLLCAPLAGRDGEVMAVIYADRSQLPSFDEQHFELLGALAAIASPALENALCLRWLENENRRLQGLQLCHELVGESAAMRRLLDLIARVARTEATVLIRGESGTGKELAAQAIHRSSPRAEGPFVAVNCATLSENLLESELFGHERGAFTGAVERHVGKIEAARGGTLFLDEVAEMKPTLQAKLLRVLQERQFERVGGTRPITADVRVVAATHRNLEAAIREGTFREDLYYRLKVITLEPPPLRQRREDIPLLASHFVALHSRRLGRRGVGLSTHARKCLMAYSWPGNVRELGNAIERALVLGETDLIRVEDLPSEVVEGSNEPANELQDSVAEHKRRLVLDAWRQSGGNYAATAALLGVHVNSLHRMIRRLGLKSELER